MANERSASIDRIVYPVFPMCLGSHRMTLWHESTIVRIFECRRCGATLNVPLSLAAADPLRS